MPTRHFEDSAGDVWDVWDVHPEDAGLGRRPTPPSAQRLDASADRPSLAQELAAGWLCFQSPRERRRFAPIPPHWHELPDGVLRVILDVADPVAPRAVAPGRGREPE
jgi:hypothetical protein